MDLNQLRSGQDFGALDLVLLGRYLVGLVALQQVVEALVLFRGDRQRRPFERRKVRGSRIAGAGSGLRVGHGLHALPNRFTCFGNRFRIGFGPRLGVAANLLSHGLARLGDTVRFRRLRGGRGGRSAQRWLRRRGRGGGDCHRRRTGSRSLYWGRGRCRRTFLDSLTNRFTCFGNGIVISPLHWRGRRRNWRIGSNRYGSRS